MNFEKVEKSETNVLAEKLLEHLMSGRRPNDATIAQLIEMLQKEPKVLLQTSHQESLQTGVEERVLQSMEKFLQQSTQGRPLFKTEGIDAHDVRGSSAVIQQIAKMIDDGKTIFEISRGIDYLNEFDTKVGGSAFGLRFDTSLNKILRSKLLHFLSNFKINTEKDLVEYSRLWQRTVDLNKENRLILYAFEKGDKEALAKAQQIIRESLR